MATLNREAWLTKLSGLMRTHFNRKGYTVPANVRITCGFPGSGGLAKKKRRIGEVWYSEASADQHYEIFISPTLSEPLRVAGVLAHEMVHVVAGKEAGHGREFRECATSIGLIGKMTATTEGEEFAAVVEPMLAKLGAYPHGELTASGQKKQGTRLLKCQCAECGYPVRVTQKWLDDVGAPLCACNSEPMEVV